MVTGAGKGGAHFLYCCSPGNLHRAFAEEMLEEGSERFRGSWLAGWEEGIDDELSALSISTHANDISDAGHVHDLDVPATDRGGRATFH